jgi:hypothetical protein
VSEDIQEKAEFSNTIPLVHAPVMTEAAQHVH